MKAENAANLRKSPVIAAPKSQMKDFLADDHDEASTGASTPKGKPIADLFPQATIMFAGKFCWVLKLRVD